MRTILMFLFVLITFSCSPQVTKYSTANAHSHNDYEQDTPFYKAYANSFGSIEVDIFLHQGELVVAHDSVQLEQGRTLDSLYLIPLQNAIQQHGGSAYQDKTRALQLMVDIKSEATTTLNKLIEIINSYDALKNSSTLHIVISGNRPPASDFVKYPSWIFFDGELNENYTPAELSRIPMLSDNFANYSNWKAAGDMAAQDKKLIKHIIDKAHRLKKKVRFWNAPDNPQSWQLFQELGVDYINTDKIDELSQFLGR